MNLKTKKILCAVVAIAIAATAAFWLAPIPLGIRQQVSTGNVQKMQISSVKGGEASPAASVENGITQKKFLNYIGGLKVAGRFPVPFTGDEPVYVVSCRVNSQWMRFEITDSAVMYQDIFGNSHFYAISSGGGTLKELNTIFGTSVKK